MGGEAQGDAEKSKSAKKRILDMGKRNIITEEELLLGEATASFVAALFWMIRRR